MRFVDMHCHLGLMANGGEVARDAHARGIGILDASVTPGEGIAAQRRDARLPNVRAALGLHPWWIDDGRCGDDEVALLEERLGETRFVGEIGLDFAPRRVASRERQTEAFARFVRACAARPVDGRVVTLHAVRAASAVLDLLEECGLARTATCILHWFSGTSDELVRARRLGCWFSVNEHMLATRKGREYARIVPQDRLLLETDAPPGADAPYSAAELEASLRRTLDALAELRRADRDALAADIAARSARLLGLA